MNYTFVCSNSNKIKKIEKLKNKINFFVIAIWQQCRRWAEVFRSFLHPFHVHCKVCGVVRRMCVSNSLFFISIHRQIQHAQE